MHVFVIPSWFPHRCYPLEGEYVREQAIAFAECRPDAVVSLGLWGQGQGHLTWAHVLHSPRCPLEFVFRTRETLDFAPRVRGYVEPRWTWNMRLAGGNRGGILVAMRRSLARAEAASGPVHVLHAHVSVPAGWVALRLARERGLPYVVTEHMGPFPLPIYSCRDSTLLPEIREALEHADARIAVSPTLADAIAGHGIARPEVVPNVVDERLYSPRERRRGSVFEWFTLCGMEYAKGIFDLLDAIAGLRPRLGDPTRPQVRFRLGGEGPALAAFRARAMTLGLDPWVEWLGLLTREQARTEFARCDAFVLPSHHESFGIVLVEAIASGRPVVATRCGGPESIVRDLNGRLVEVARPDQLGEAMTEVMDHIDRFDPTRIRSDFLMRYSRAAVSSALGEVYDRVRAAPSLDPSSHTGAAR